MSVATKPKGLGKGLSALFAEDSETSVSVEFRPSAAPTNELPLSKIIPNENQPRRLFTDSEIKELSSSIRENGVLQPLIVRPLEGKQSGMYQIIAGERRYRASKAAGLHSVPVIIRNVTEVESLELAIIENIQRQDLTSIEEAASYRRLMDEFNLTQEEVAAKVGKSRSHIANLLRLLVLPDNVKTMIDKGELSMGHARALISFDDPTSVAKKIVSEGWSVRDVENFAKVGKAVAEVANDSTPKPAPTASIAPAAPQAKTGDLGQIEASIARALGLKVSINASGTKGEVVIEFKNLAELDSLLEKVGA